MIIPSTHLSLLIPLPKEAQNEQGWQMFHARYHDVILTWCSRALPFAAAEDLTQEIWLKLLRDLHTYDPAKGRLRSWLKAVVHNALRDCWRRQQNKPEGGVGGTVFQERLAGLADPDWEAAADELSGVLEQRADTQAALVVARVRARVEEKTWQAAHLVLVDQRPAAEVAKELGVSVATVYKHTYRVKQMLQEEYLHVYPEDRGGDVPGPGTAVGVSE